MSRLIQLRQRIKAIETTQKVTHAMRLISMSSHSQLKSKEQSLRAYQKTVSTLFGRLQVLTQTSSQTSAEKPSIKAINKPLLIVVGSQKGLCGTFNSDLFTFFEQQFHENSATTLETFPTLSVTTHMNIMRSIADLIDLQPYSSVIIISNGLKSFFLQKPQKTVLLPISYTPTDAVSTHHEEFNDFVWEEDPFSLHEAALKQYIEVNLHFQLFQSLLAEHAARFISMDNATRNAKNLLEKAQLDYNKLRQAKITKELTELASTLIV
jgi:F-type H+-transporting ATPase subunit gamma